MVEDDVQLIRRILSGDSEAFTALVKKHQKGVHALAWRRIGDFHHAEEITQDAFVRVYKHLPKLKDPNQFSGWLYVITNRLCNTWLQGNKSLIGSLEDVPVAEVHRTSYERYISEQHETDAREHRHELVKKLLEKLPESERTVMTLYYLGEMTTKEISKFLGVSVHTITSRLQRARERLKQDEELLVQEVLGSVPLPASLTESIVQKVADIKLTPPTAGKPLLPWAAFGAAVVLVTLLLLGLSNQYLNYFQKPYSFEAQSEPTIEIIDAPIVLDIESKPNVRNQVGRAVTTDKNVSTGAQISNTVLTPTEGVNFSKSSTLQWTQTIAPQTGPIFDIFATSTGMLYAASPTGVYRLPADTTTWMPVNISAPIKGNRMPMAEYAGTSYIVATDEIFASTDEGKTWKVFCPRPKGHAVGLIVMNETRSDNSRTDIAMYLALQNKGVFRSTDAGTHWTPINNGLTEKKISAVATIGNTLFAGTNRGLYRFGLGVWQQLPVTPSQAIHSLEVMKNDLYVATAPDLSIVKPHELSPRERRPVVRVKDLDSKRIFRSADLGATWTEITPTSKSSFMRVPSGMKISVAGEALLVTGASNFYSTDRGQTWISLGFDPNSFMVSRFPVVAVDENTFYKAGGFGIQRTVDGGKSWHSFMNGMVGTRVLNLVVHNNRLYAHTGSAIAESTDGGVSWKGIGSVVNDRTLEPIAEEQLLVDFSFDSRLVVADGVLYEIVPEAENVRVFYLSAKRNEFIPVHGIPAFDRETRPNSVEKGDQLTTMLNTITDFTEVGSFAISDKTFYAEYKGKLLKWQPGDAEWKDTGLVDTNEQVDKDLKNGFKLAASGKVVYVGKQDGKLFQSLDGGDSWRDVTSSLPFSFTRFKEIVFTGSTVYIATDKGVLSSQTGAHWRVLTDGTGERIVIDRFAIDHTRVYGAGDTGVYHLDADNKLEQISPSVPGKVLSLAVDRNRLHILTQQRRMFHISLEEENYALSRK
ncbi:sigma-70 family RNA polymerase sigma factor [Candidatus Poribacteria bacterium]|nr:sigma-70 family RNA polymerase sigma factor [Candidatus Poribacteria bacterium]